MMGTRVGQGLGALVLAVALAACFSGSGNTPGTYHGPCYPNDTCNEGLYCLGDMCVHEPDARPPDAYIPPPPDAYVPPPDAYVPPDAPGFQCGADAVLEPNESIADPTPTPIPDFGDEYGLLGMQICPDTDVDVFHLRVDAVGTDLVVTVTYVSADGDLALELLNSTGSTIQYGTHPGDPDVLQAEVHDLAAGSYFAEVRANGFGVENDYDIQLSTGDWF